MFQERSYMRGTFPDLGLKEIFLKNKNLGNKELYLLIHNLRSFLLISLDWVVRENLMRTKENSVVSKKNQFGLSTSPVAMTT